MTERRIDMGWRDAGADYELFAASLKEKRDQAGPARRVLNFNRALAALPEAMPYSERHVRAMSAALKAEAVILCAHELLTGILWQCDEPAPLPPGAEDERWRWSRETAKRVPNHGYGAPGHIGWHWERVLADGVDAILADLRRRSAAAADAEAKLFFDQAIFAWEAVLAWNDAHVAALENALAAAVSEVEKKRLRLLAEICRKVPRRPAESFHEALQSFHFQHLAVMFENAFGGNGPGRVDFHLWPYLKKDLASGKLTLPEARRLIAEWYDRCEERLRPIDGWVEAVMVGGSAPDGSNTVNPLSELLLEVYIGRLQTHPMIYPRWRDDDPASYRKLCVEYLLDGTNRAQIYGETATLAAMTAGAIPFADAVDYMAGGCMELSPAGRNSDMNLMACSNVAKCFELALHAAPAAAGFEELWERFTAAIVEEFLFIARLGVITSEEMARWRPTPLLSTLVDDCLERGRDQQAGGARYDDYGVALLGVSTVADQFYALQKTLFAPEPPFSMAELLAALEDDFKHAPAMMAKLRAVPKFGCGDPEADAMCDRVMELICRTAVATKTRFGGCLRPMIFNFTWTPGASGELKARADGAHAGEYIGHGMTPAPIALHRSDFTTAMNSCLSLDLNPVTGGATTMWDFDAEWATPQLLEAVLTRFFAAGGMIFQGNMSDAKQLELALEHPENYPPVIVRVGGFSSFFHLLDRKLREEIVRRKRHAG